MAKSADQDDYTDISTGLYDGSENDRPLAVISGWGDSTENPHWQQYLNELDQVYDGPITEVPIDSPYGHPENLAATAKDTIEETYRRYDDTAVNVVAHSMGGLTARQAIEELGGDEYVDTLVTLGTPHEGAPNAFLDWITGGGQAMRPGSDFLQELNEDLSGDVDYIAVYSTTDEVMRTVGIGYVPFWRNMVKDIESGRIPHADEYDAENIKVSGYGHFDLLTDDDILNMYIDDLKTDAEKPSDT